MTIVPKKPVVAVMRFTDKSSALDSQNQYYDIIKHGDGQWIAGEPFYPKRQIAFNKEADRVIQFPIFNGIMFHGYTFTAQSDDRRNFDIACYRMHEYLMGLYSAPGMDGKCLGAFMCYQAKATAGMPERQSLEHSFNIVYSGCQIEDRVSWLTVLHEPTYFEDYLILLKKKWSSLITASKE